MIQGSDAALACATSTLEIPLHEVDMCPVGIHRAAKRWHTEGRHVYLVPMTVVLTIRTHECRTHTLTAGWETSATLLSSSAFLPICGLHEGHPVGDTRESGN